MQKGTRYPSTQCSVQRKLFKCHMVRLSLDTIENQSYRPVRHQSSTYSVGCILVFCVHSNHNPKWYKNIVALWYLDIILWPLDFWAGRLHLSSCPTWSSRSTLLCPSLWVLFPLVPKSLGPLRLYWQLWLSLGTRARGYTEHKPRLFPMWKSSPFGSSELYCVLFNKVVPVTMNITTPWFSPK